MTPAPMQRVLASFCVCRLWAIGGHASVSGASYCTSCKLCAVLTRNPRVVYFVLKKGRKIRRCSVSPKTIFDLFMTGAFHVLLVGKLKQRKDNNPDKKSCNREFFKLPLTIQFCLRSLSFIFMFTHQSDLFFELL